MDPQPAEPEKTTEMTPIQAPISGKFEFTLAVGAAVGPSCINFASQITNGTMAMPESFYWGTLAAGLGAEFLAQDKSLVQRFGASVAMGSVIPIGLNKIAIQGDVASALAFAILGGLAIKMGVSKKMRGAAAAGMFMGAVLGGVLQIQGAHYFRQMRQELILDRLNRILPHLPQTAPGIKVKPTI